MERVVLCPCWHPDNCCPYYSIMAMFTVLITLLFITQTFGLTQYEHSVKILHYILPHWGESVSGLQECGNIACDWTHSEHVKQLKDNLYFTEPRNGVPTLSLALYNIHSLWERMRILHPLHCDLITNLTMTESEESKIRYGYLFDQGYKNFDGYTSTSPNAAVQRVYIETHLNSSHFLTPLNFSSLIKGASYVASDCHRHDSANADRDSVVHRIRQEGFRVDGLGTRASPLLCFSSTAYIYLYISLLATLFFTSYILFRSLYASNRPRRN